MKYVMLEMRNGMRLPILFPELLVHAHVAGAMQNVLGATVLGSDRDFHERQLQARLEEAKYTDFGAPPISAGFVNVSEAHVHGLSETLNLKSSPFDEARIVLGHSVQSMPDDLVGTTYNLYKHRNDK